MTVPHTPHVVTSANVTDGREAYPKHWIALYTRPRSEKKAQSYLNKMGLETYLPIQKQTRQWTDRKKKLDIVVIPMVIFVYVDDSTPNTSLTHPLIIRPFTMPGCKEIATIPPAQIETLKYILGQSDYPVQFDPTTFHIKDKVRVTRGPLIGLTGEVISHDSDSLELTVNIGLGTARLNIEKNNVELL